MRVLAMSLFLAMVVLMAGLAQAGPKANANIKGWEKGGEYDRLFDPKEADSMKGNVVRIMEITPFPGMAPGIGLEVEDKTDKTVEVVHLGPKDFVDLDTIGLKEGDRVKIVGAWAEVDGQDILMAVKVKKGENTQLKVRRTRDGYPYWSMTPEQRRAEQTGQ